MGGMFSFAHCRHCGEEGEDVFYFPLLRIEWWDHFSLSQVFFKAVTLSLLHFSLVCYRLCGCFTFLLNNKILIIKLMLIILLSLFDIICLSK